MQSNDRIIKQAITWSATNSLIYTDGNLNWGHAPLALVPNSFPKESFNYIKKIQPIFNILVDSISRDKDFLTSTLSQASQADEFTKRLLDILHELPENSIKNSINLGIHRSDYMLQIEEAEGRLNNKILQVEINTIASSFGCLSRKIGDLHRYLLTRNSGKVDLENVLIQTDADYSLDPSKAAAKIPENPSIRLLGLSIAMAHFLFGDPNSIVIFVVQPDEKNFGDQRHLENELWNTHNVRVEFMTLAEIHEKCRIVNGNILSAKLMDGLESVVSVVYFRSGYSPDDYPTEKEWSARKMIEFSSATKCPTVAYQLTGAKRIQQRLSEPGVVEMFLPPEESKLLRKCFAAQYSLGIESEMTEVALEAYHQAMEDGDPWVLKPQREGGGNNYYGENVSKFLQENKNSAVLAGYVLMQRILPMIQKSAFLRKGSLQILPSVSEYGIYGVFLGAGSGSPMLNEYAGYLVRTKPSGVDEGGVATGYSVLNSLVLSGEDNDSLDEEFGVSLDQDENGLPESNQYGGSASRSGNDNLTEQNLLIEMLEEKKRSSSS